MKAWCVVSTLPHQEARAEANLLRQGFCAWLPMIRQVRRHARQFHAVRAPVFPGYLFVELDLERGGWSPIDSTYGVRRLLAHDRKPDTLPERFVVDLRKTIVEDGTCGLSRECDSLQPGARVRIAWGPFADCYATILDLAPKQRAFLLLDLLGGRVKMTMSRLALLPEV
jgi:transcriptional antiterminator RfaH